MKLATELVVEQSGIGWTTLPATQFHDLILTVARALARLPVIPAPTGSRFQPVDAAEVADRMAELALGEPPGLVPDLAGPKIYTVAELVNSYLSAVGKRRPLVPVHIPGQAARALRAGANLAQIAPSATGRGRNSWPTGSRAPRTSRSGAALALA
jgi:uncharacterized protein YbjT (DUF2867 family)